MAPKGAIFITRNCPLKTRVAMRIRLIYRPNKGIPPEHDKIKKRKKRSKNLAFRLHRHFMYHAKRNYWLVKKRPWLFRTLMVFPTILILGILGIFGFMYFYTGDLKDDNGQPIDFGRLSRNDYNRASYILDTNGEIIGRIFAEIRDPLTSKEIPALLKNSFVAAEDKRFYSWKQFGIDPFATLRAGIIETFHKVGFKYGNRSGASGIAQQDSRLFYGDEITEFQNRTPSLSRKFKEARFAIQLVKKYSKDKIFENFLNMIYFGHGVNGAAEACRYYFGKDIRKEKLTPKEVAILVSLNKSPSKYCPIYHEPAKLTVKEGQTPEEIKDDEYQYQKDLAKEMTRVTLARERYNWVLKRMKEESYITEKEFRSSIFNGHERLQMSILHITPLKNPEFGYTNRFVKEMLLITEHDDEDLSYYGGYKILTTIDSKIQHIADEEFKKHLANLNLEKDPNDKSDQIEGAFVIIEVKTGNILAMSGGHDFSESQYNRAMASRSPGSGFKPLVYGAALEYANYDLSSKICNCSFSMKGANGKRWAPRNFREKNAVPAGYINLTTGVIRSVNLATLNLARNIGIDFVIQFANTLGVWGNTGMVRDSDGKVWFRKPGLENVFKNGLDPRLPTAIGASDVNLIELTNAYAVFFRDGIYLKPNIIKKIRSYNGKTLYSSGNPQAKKAISEKTSREIISMLRAVTKVGTAKMSMKNIQQQVAVKTGTSNGPTDVGMFGGTPEIVMAIRLGHDNHKIIELPGYLKKTIGTTEFGATGGSIVGPLYRKIIDRIYQDRPKIEFNPEIEVTVQQLLDNYHDK
jgi:membrane peptidoglycan carboxypeptidase